MTRENRIDRLLLVGEARIRVYHLRLTGERIPSHLRSISRHRAARTNSFGALGRTPEMRLLLALAVLLVPLSLSLSSVAEERACPPVPAPTMGIPKPPREEQAAFDTPSRPAFIPTNARLRVRSVVGPLETVHVQLLVNGVAVAFERAVSDGQIEITPKTSLPPRANVVVMVDDIRTATYTVGTTPDAHAPTLANATVERVSLAVPGPVCPPAAPADLVTGTVEVDDESVVRANVTLVRATGAVVQPVSAYVTRGRTSLGTFPRPSPFGVRLASGTLSPGEQATLRFVVIDVAGNVSPPLDVPIVAPGAPDAGAIDAGRSGPSSTPRRGC